MLTGRRLVHLFSVSTQLARPSTARVRTWIASAVFVALAMLFIGPVSSRAADGLAPEITTQPQGQTIVAGTGVTFSVTATGTPALTYQWYKNGAPIPFAKAASYTISKTTAASAGFYSVVVSNAFGSAASLDVDLVIRIPPTFTQEIGSLTAIYGDGVFLIVGATATDPFTFQWRRNGVDIPGANDSELDIENATIEDAGDYTVVISNEYGTATSQVGRLKVVPPVPEFSLSQLDIPRSGPVSATFSIWGAIPGLKYFATGLPAGLTLDSDTGLLTGRVTAKPGIYPVTYWTQCGSVKSALTTRLIVITDFPALFTGGFEALLLDESERPVGKVVFTVSKTGAFTGTLISAEDKDRPFKGALLVDEGYLTASATVSVARGTGVEPFTLTLKLDQGEACSAAIDGFGRTNAGEKLAVFSKSYPCPSKGAYTLVISAESDDGDGWRPRGHGYATATISASGALTLSGKLADGAKLTGTLRHGVYGSYFGYVKPYRTAGNYFAGALRRYWLWNGAGTFEITEANFVWRKPAAPKDKLFPGGFGPLACTIEMERWQVPSGDNNLPGRLGLSPYSDTLVVIGEGASWFAGDETFDTTDLIVPLEINSAGVVSVIGETNPASFKLKIAAKTGAFSGSFKIGGRTVPFEGVLLQRPKPITRGDTVVGFGNFVQPEGKEVPALTGSLQFVAP